MKEARGRGTEAENTVRESAAILRSSVSALTFLSESWAESLGDPTLHSHVLSVGFSFRRFAHFWPSFRLSEQGDASSRT